MGKEKFKCKDYRKGHPNCKKYLDEEGRVIRIDIDDKLSVISVYVPNGGKSEDAYKGKLIFYKDLFEYVKSINDSGRVCILGGDMNCAATEDDVDQPERHLNNTCFREEVRKIFNTYPDYELIDSFRHFYQIKRRLILIGIILIFLFLEEQRQEK